VMRMPLPSPHDGWRLALPAMLGVLSALTRIGPWFLRSIPPSDFA
jgi:hypothetical protein